MSSAENTPSGVAPLPAPALLSEEEARERILGRAVPLPVTVVPLAAALGRFAAREVRATQALPGFDNSSMDGYALAFAHDEHTINSPQGPRPLPAGTRLRVEGEQRAGPSRGLRARPGQAVRIFTGAPVPEGTTAVVMQEDVERVGDEITLLAAVEPGEYIRRAGADLARGQKLFDAGEKLTAQRLGLLASQGMAEVAVRRAARVAILATGDELRAPGEPLGPGEIYESNSVLLSALATQLGASTRILPRAADERADLDAKLAAGLDGHDVLIVAGGVSVGERDFVKERLAAAGVRLDLWRVAVQPGKPFLYGFRPGAEDAGGTHVFGLPGNPVSAFVTFLLFVRPALLKLMGADTLECQLPGFPAVAGEDLVNRGNRPHYLRGRLDGNGRFFPCGRQESHAVFGLSRSDVLARVEPGAVVTAGTPVSARVWAV